MRRAPKSVALRPNERLTYWRHHSLGDATLLQARYGPFKWEKHVHDEQVVVISERGAGEVQTCKGREVGGAGTIWVFAPGEYHFGRVEEGNEWHYRALYLDRAVLTTIGSQLGLDRSVILKPGLHSDAALANVLLRAHSFELPDRAAEQTAWNDALVELFSKYADRRVTLEHRAMGRAGLELARSYIAEHFRDDISIDDLARLVNVSRYHFIRAFRSAFGMPPHAYLNQVRLQQARRLLLAGKTATQAASECGFYDQSRLTHLFKRVYGVTPARYAHLANF